MDLEVNEKAYPVQSVSDTDNVQMMRKARIDALLNNKAISDGDIIYDVPVKKKFIVNSVSVLKQIDKNKLKEAQDVISK
jgi:hypothetical protein